VIAERETPSAVIAERSFLVDRPVVAVEVGSLVELERIDEDRDTHRVRSFRGVADECEMAVVQRAHRGNEADGAALPMLGSRPLERLGGRGEELHRRTDGQRSR
jgi:hypothetical protein